jgi:polyhydroxyalkanoate synthesis regulator phasin
MNKEQITYEVREDGYMLKLDGKDWILQHKEHVFFPEKSLEENAELHIEELCKPVEDMPSKDEEIARLQEQVAALQAQVASLVNA